MKAKMPARMPGRVQRAQLSVGFTLKRKHFIIFNETIDWELLLQRFGSRTMCGNSNARSMALFQMIIQSVHASDMIRVYMRKNNLAHHPAFRDQFVKTRSQRLLLVFIRRPGIDYQDFPRRVNQIRISVRCRRQGLRTDRHANVVRMELDAARWLAMRFRHGKKSFDQVMGEAIGQSLQRMQNWRHRDDFASFPFCISVTRGNPLAAFEFRIGSHPRLLLWRRVDQEKPGVEPSRRKRRRHPTADKSEITRVEMQAVMSQQLRPRHSFRFEIVKQRSPLTRGQGL